MTVETLLPFAPFLALLYVVFALIQAARKQQQGTGAAIVAVIALAVPLAALVLTQDTTIRASMAGYLTLNALIVFVASIVILMIERGNPARAANRSYGMLGIGLGVLIAVVSLAYPLVLAPRTTATARNGNTFNAASAGNADNSTIQNVSQSTSSAGGQASPVTDVLTTQTGLTTEELTTQMQSGSKIADLVAQHNGDLKAVTTAITTSLDSLKAEGGRRAQILSTLGDDTGTIATQFVQGELEARAQQILTAVLVGGGRGFGQGGQNGAGGGFPQGGQSATGNGNGATGSFPQGGQDSVSAANAPTGDVTPGAPTGFGNPPAVAQNPSQSQVTGSETPSAPSGFGNRSGNAPAGAQDPGQVASVATAQPTESPATATEVVIRPTVISFPSATPTPAVPAQAAQSTDEAAATAAGATCTVTPLYNLNLREQPNTNGTIYLSIPFGTQVTSDGRTQDDWYHVTYDGKTGWVSGEYLTANPTCDSVAVLKADS